MDIDLFYKTLCSVLSTYITTGVPDPATANHTQVHLGLIALGRDKLDFEVQSGGFNNLGCRYFGTIKLPSDKTNITISGLVTLKDNIELRIGVENVKIVDSTVQKVALIEFNLSNERSLMTFKGNPDLELFDELEVIDAALGSINVEWDFASRIALAKAWHHLQ